MAYSKAYPLYQRHLTYDDEQVVMHNFLRAGSTKTPIGCPLARLALTKLLQANVRPLME